MADRRKCDQKPCDWTWGTFTFSFRFFFFCGWIQNCYARLSALGKRMSGACSTNKLCEQHTSTWPEFDLVISRSAVAWIGSFHSAPSSARVAQAFAVRCRTRLGEWLSRVSHVLPRCASEKSPSWLSPGIRPRLLIRLISARTTHSVRFGRWETGALNAVELRSGECSSSFSLLLKLTYHWDKV